MAPIASSLLRFLYTLFLFTRSDFKTVVIPVAFFAATSAPVHNVGRLPHVIFWIWLHLLQVSTANQSLHPEEDALNKTYRPLPSKRISVAEARLLRWLLLPVCCTLSFVYSTETLCTSFLIAAYALLYNELGGGNHWFGKNTLNALAYAGFEGGATLVAGIDRTRLGDVAVLSLATSVGVIVTTIHAQDFQDMEGDSARGRRTLPMVFGAASKYTVVFPMVPWSAALWSLWDLVIVAGTALLSFAAFVGSTYIRADNQEGSYESAYRRYNAWLSCVHLLPAYYRAVNRSYRSE